MINLKLMASIPDDVLPGRANLIDGANQWTTREIDCLDWFSFTSLLKEGDLTPDNDPATAGYCKQFWSNTTYRHQRYDYGKLLFC